MTKLKVIAGKDQLYAECSQYVDGFRKLYAEDENLKDADDQQIQKAIQKVVNLDFAEKRRSAIKRVK